ncbi:MAG: hypothetical protein ACREGB_03960 [Candidatus Saccharimonadales bacterium]
MSRFGKEGSSWRKPAFRSASKKHMRLGLIALLAGFIMVVASATIFAGAASAAPGDISVTPIAPAATTPSCANPVKTITPPNQVGVSWLVNGQPAGVTNLNPGDSVAYIAEADQGYEIAAGAQTNFLFANVFDPSTCATVIPVPAQPGVTNPPGPNNATWNVPASTSTLKWTDVNGDLVVTIVASNTTFPDGSTTHDYGVAPDPDKAGGGGGSTSVTPAAPSATQPSCKHTYETVTPSNQAGVNWNHNQVTLKVGESVKFTASPAKGFKFPSGAKASWSFTNDFNTKACGSKTPPVTVTHHHPTPVGGQSHSAVGPQLGTGSDGPTGLKNVSATSQTLLYMFAGLLALLGLGSAGAGTLEFCRARRGTHRS